ncbi:MAG: hypothetical protein HY328_19660 [Chloroflexi bacterium]|nr:hypothetical protein [Chloroflexota bacterium]
MTPVTTQTIEDAFLTLGREERVQIITHGAAFRLSGLRNRLFLAQSKIEHFQAKYGKSLEEIEREGLPEDANYEMHEDYIFWHHWSEAAQNAEKEIERLKQITRFGLYLEN